MSHVFDRGEQSRTPSDPWELEKQNWEKSDHEARLQERIVSPVCLGLLPHFAPSLLFMIATMSVFISLATMAWLHENMAKAQADGMFDFQVRLLVALLLLMSLW